jgi:probable F420-dependent oxidoreductase
VELGRIGVWSGLLRTGDEGASREAAAELEELGYTTIWFPGGAERELHASAERLLAATRRVVVATGILNIWAYEPERAAREHAELARAYPDRFLLGLGVGHATTVEANLGRAYVRPYSAMTAFLDGLDAAQPPVASSARCLAALGPRMLELARDRALGAHPYLVDPNHTAMARELLGPQALLAPEQMVVLSEDAAHARAVARATLTRYATLPNYTNNYLRIGYEEADLADGGSDRLVDGIIAWGDEEVIAARVKEHFDAGADHVCVQVLTDEPATFPYAEWRRLASAFAT